MYVELRTPEGTPISQVDKTPSSITPGTTRGYPSIGADYKTPRLIRSFSDGAQVESLPNLLFWEPVEGSAFNSNLWTQTLTSFTVTQATGGITFNAGASAAIGAGALHLSNKWVPLPPKAKLILRSRQRHTTHYNNNLIEFGIANNATSATATLTSLSANGAFWQKDGTGQYTPKIIIAGSEYAGTALSNASFIAQVPATEYALFEVEMDQDGAWFRIYTSLGVLVTGSEQRIDLPSAITGWSVTHFQVFARSYNNAATGTAVQLILGATAVYSLDTVSGRSWPQIVAGLGLNSLVSPLTAWGQTANYTNVTAPTTRTVTNTTELETTLGGHVSWNNAGTSFGTNEAALSDLILFGYTVPANYALFINGLRLSTVNLGAANGAAIYTIEYFLAYNHTGATLAAGSPRFVPLGFQTLANGAAIGAAFDKDTIWQPVTPIMVLPGRRVAIGARVIGASIATVSQVIRTIATVDGWFE